MCDPSQDAIALNSLIAVTNTVRRVTPKYDKIALKGGCYQVVTIEGLQRVKV